MSDIIRGKKEVDELERKINELIHDYDMFFQGIEKIEPIRKKEELKRLISKISTLKLNNAIIKQKYANLVSRFNTYDRYWANIWLKIENGTYTRDLYKMELKKKLQHKTNESEKSEENNNQTNDENNNQKQETSSENDYKQVYKQFVTAQELLGSKPNVDYEKLSQKLKEQEAALKEKYNCKSVEFKVVVKDGKVTFRPLLITE